MRGTDGTPHRSPWGWAKPTEAWLRTTQEDRLFHYRDIAVVLVGRRNALDTRRLTLDQLVGVRIPVPQPME